MASLDSHDSRQVGKEREFHPVDLIPCGWRSAERPEIEARLYEIEGTLKRWLQVKIAEIESVHGFEEEAMMSTGDRDILEMLKSELNFIELGGYGRSVRTPWQAKSAFQDSLTCMNYGHPTKVHACDECHLIDFVPGECRSEAVPCHFIPLNEFGDTIDTLELEDNQHKLEEALKAWLRAKIEEIEARRLARMTKGET